MNHIIAVAHDTTDSFVRRVQENPALAMDLLRSVRELLPEVEHLEACEAIADDGFGARLRGLRLMVARAKTAVAAAESTP